jgi:hypothetical protein
MRETWGERERERDKTLTPESFSSFSMESMTSSSSPSSLIQIGRGVPQNLLRLTAQSLAFSSQLWNRFSFSMTKEQREKVLQQLKIYYIFPNREYLCLLSTTLITIHRNNVLLVYNIELT